MNHKHAAALLLFGAGAFLLLVGLIFGGIGVAQLFHSQDEIAFEVSLAFAGFGLAVLLVAAGALVFAVRLYRRSDHHLEEVRDAHGHVIAHRFPVLSPVILVGFALLTAWLVWITAEYGFDWQNPKAVRLYVGWGILTVAVIGAAGRALLKRLSGLPHHHAGPDEPASPEH